MSNPISSPLSKLCAAIAVAILITTSAFGISGYTRVYNFSGGLDGRDPATKITFDSEGNIYGTTAAGGDFDFGSVFKLTPTGDGWVQTTIYSFAGGNDG